MNSESQTANIVTGIMIPKKVTRYAILPKMFHADHSGGVNSRSKSLIRSPYHIRP